MTLSGGPIERVAVLGAGSWGTTYAKVLADAGRSVTLWARRESVAAAVRREHVNSDYLPGVRLPDNVGATSDFDEALDGVDAVVLGVPSQALRENLRVFRDSLPPTVPIVSLAKGVEIGTGLRMSEVIARVGQVDPARIVVLTGPNLAVEIALGRPTAKARSWSVQAITVAVGRPRAISTARFGPVSTTMRAGSTWPTLAITSLIRSPVPIVSLAKGVEIGTGLRMSEVIARVGQVDPARIVVLTGPNLAVEIALGRPTATVMACTDHERAFAVQVASATPYFRPYTITDVVGAEIAGTGKNIVALACGIADGLGLGLNASASLITRGLNEVSRLGVELGASPATFAGLAGLGDLVATCWSPLSRNRTLGGRLAAGIGLDAAMQATGGQVAEGVVSCRSVRDLALRHKIDMPITESVYQVCYRHLPPTQMMSYLMDQPHSQE